MMGDMTLGITQRQDTDEGPNMILTDPKVTSCSCVT